MTAPARRPPAWLTLAALWLLVFSVTTQTMILAPILPRVAEQLRISEGRVALISTGYSVAVALVAVAAGPVSDRVGRRRMLLAGAAAMTAGLALHALALGFGSFLAVRVLTGAGGGVLTGATAAYVGDYFPPERRGWANGWVMSGMAAGQVLGIPVGTLLAARSGFRAPFLVFAATMGIAWLMIVRWVPHAEVELQRAPLGARYLLRHYRALLAQREAAVAVLSSFGMFGGTALYILFLPTWLEDARGATPGQVALLFAIGGVATVLTGPPAGRLSDRTGRKRLVIGASVGLALGIAAMVPLARSMAGAYLLFGVTMALFAARASPFQAMMAELVPDRQRGSLMSLSMAVGQAGSGVGSALAGATYAYWGFGGNTIVAACAALAMAALVALYLPETMRRGRALC
ncbi:MAG TPA: MFS transporter [Longimicrobium sp.]|nr:MFS transporter [Longimicrobium sp.]